MSATLLRGATFTDGTRGNVRIEDGCITSVTPSASGGAAEGADVVDLDGYVVLPSAVEPHAHLDKAFLADLVPNPTGDLLGAIEAMDRHRDVMTVEGTADRAERAALRMAANGYTAVRTHADTVVDHGLTSVHALVEARRRVANVIDVEIVALAGWPVAGDAGADQRAMLVDALAAGADVVGGCPHLDDAGTRSATETLLELAAEVGRPIDLHVDETLDESVAGLAELAELVIATGFPHPVTASHCVSLGMQPIGVQQRTAELVAAAGIGVVALPHTNLYLQGRDHPSAMPRGLTAVDRLRSAGAVVAAGADNLQDPFNPLGRACPFETAGLMVLVAHLSPAVAFASVSDAARCVLGLPAVSLSPGSPADLLAVRAASLREAIALGPSGPGDRLIWRAGRQTKF